VATLLPDGQVLIAGSTEYTNDTELYDPASGLWTSAGNLSSECYDPGMTLLRNGKVLVTGGSYPGGWPPFANVELFDPGLGFTNSAQPQILSISTSVNPGAPLTVTGTGFVGRSEGSTGGTPNSPANYPLVQVRSIEGGRTAFLPVANWGTNVFASQPVTGLAPGYALATVFANGIPSTSSIVNIPVSIPVATSLSKVWNAPVGFQFTFTNRVNALLGVLMSTNVSQPLSAWAPAGSVTEVAPGQFQFTDSQATNGGQRYYQIYEP
jgi:hypothetical protein